MDLISHELTKFKHKCESFERNVDLMATEAKLMRQLLAFEHRFSQHVFDLLMRYDRYVIDHVVVSANGSNGTASSAAAVRKQLTDDKAIAVQNLLQLKTWRQELCNWRAANGMNGDTDSLLPTTITADDQSVLDTSGAAEAVPAKTSAGLSDNMLRSMLSSGAASSSSATTPPVITLDNSPQKTLRQMLSPSPVASTATTAAPAMTDLTPGPSASVLAQMLAPPPPVVPVVELEVIPKPEPLSDGEEDTDTASERETPGRVTRSAANPPEKPFMLFTQYLSQNKSFSHLLASNSGEPSVSAPKSGGNKIAIDLNTDSDGDQPVNSIFSNDIVDLSPTKRTKKLANKSRKRIKKRKNLWTKPKPKDTLTATSVVNNNTSAGLEVIELPQNRIERRIFNEKYVKSHKKLVYKDKTYFCKWKNCTYSSAVRNRAVRHMWSHSGENPFKCPLCDLRFRDKRHLNNHMSTHNTVSIRAAAKNSSREPNAKTKVKAKSPMKSPLKSPVYRARGSGDVVCPECGNRYQDYALLTRHMKKQHGLKKWQKYRQLGQQFLKQTNGPTAAVAKNNGNILCPDCGKTYLGIKLLLRHITRTHGSDVADKYRLNNGLVSRKAAALEPQAVNSALNSVATAIVSANVGNKSRPKLVVKSANKSVKVMSNIRKVIQKPIPMTRRHLSSEEKEWNCDYNLCPRSYNSKYNLKRHQIEIHKRLSKKLFYMTSKNEKTVKYFIPKTGSTAAAAALTVTAVSEPTGAKTAAISGPKSTQIASDKAFKCNLKGCLASYQTISGLYRHKKVKHNSNKPFKSVSKLAKTQALGVTIKYKAAIRPKLSVDEENQLVATEEDKEEEVTEFLCTYPNCAFKALGRKTLIQHFPTHFPGEDKPFKCVMTDCHYAAKVLSKLKQHVLNRHSEQQFIKAMDATGIRYPSWY